jgi:hypothetical protein
MMHRLSLFHLVGRVLFAAAWIYIGSLSAAGMNAWERQEWPITSRDERYTRARFSEALLMGILFGPVSFVLTSAMTGGFEDGFSWSFAPEQGS